MARIRSVKPEFWDDRKLAKRASRDARLLYVGLWNLADEWARLNGDPQWIKGKIFPYDEDLDAAAVAKLLEELQNPAIGAVIAYEMDGDPYLFLPKLERHQRLEPEKVPSRLPAPPAWASAPRDPDPTPPAPSSDNRQSESRADSSVRRADEVARCSDEPGPHANKPALLYVAGSMEHGAGGRESRVARDIATLACSLLEEHRLAMKPGPPRDVLRAVGEKVDSLLADPDVSADEIREGLLRLRSNRKWGPGMLPSLVHEIRQERAGEGEPRASPDRRQQATDAKFDRAMQRARAREGTT